MAVSVGTGSLRAAKASETVSDQADGVDQRAVHIEDDEAHGAYEHKSRGVHAREPQTGREAT